MCATPTRFLDLPTSLVCTRTSLTRVACGSSMYDFRGFPSFSLNLCSASAFIYLIIRHACLSLIYLNTHFNVKGHPYVYYVKAIQDPPCPIVMNRRSTRALHHIHHLRLLDRQEHIFFQRILFYSRQCQLYQMHFFLFQPELNISGTYKKKKEKKREKNHASCH